MGDPRSPCPGNHSCCGALSLKMSTASQRVGHAQWLAPARLQRREPLAPAKPEATQLGSAPKYTEFYDPGGEVDRLGYGNNIIIIIVVVALYFGVAIARRRAPACPVSWWFPRRPPGTVAAAVTQDPRIRPLYNLAGSVSAKGQQGSVGRDRQNRCLRRDAGFGKREEYHQE